MAMTFLQKVRLWWRGSQRRREDFVAKNATWGGGQAPSPVSPAGLAGVAVLQIDREGLQSAYLDQSGAILYYLDLESGDVLESRIELNDPRYARVPTQDDAADRDAFLLEHPVDAKPSFREAIAKDRALERAWYNFKNERAIAAVENWIKKVLSEKC
jgi:glutathione S-transferase